MRQTITNAYSVEIITRTSPDICGPVTVNLMSSHVGPVIMGHPVARAQLEENGSVYSFRTSDRTEGDKHYHYERTEKGQSKVTITKATPEIVPTTKYLSRFVYKSGFESPEAWLEAIEEVHGNTDDGYVYRISLRGENDE